MPCPAVDRDEPLKNDQDARRLAAIDIGSNSVRLVVAQLLPGGQFRVLDEERETTRLAHSLGSSGELSPQAIDATLVALRRFMTIAQGLSVANVRVIATCAVREAENGAELCRLVADQLGLTVEVISPQEEAQYAFLSVKQAFDLSERNVAVADIGGGSTEILFASGGLIEEIIPTHLGAVRLSEMLGAQLFADDYQRMTQLIDRELKQHLPKPPFVPQVLVGTGGTFTTLASILAAERGLQGTDVTGFRTSRANVKHLAERLHAMSLKQRRGVTGLNPDRADIIVPGLAVIDRLMRRLKVNTVRVHTGGVRDGLLWSMVDNLQGGSQRHADREEALRRFAVHCGADWPHSRHVGLLARQIYHQLASRFQLPPCDEALVEAAGMLQDVGYLINYDKHHKHSYHLISNSRLPGFHRRDLELVANIARYHRGAKPKKKHEPFRRLGPEEQQRVKQCAAILRIAGGLDRCYSQLVRRVQVQVENGETRMWIHSQGDAEVDLWAARRRADLFEKVFGTQLVLRAARK